MCTWNFLWTEIKLCLKLFTSIVKPGFHIVVVSDGDASQSVDRRCYWDAYDDMETFFGDVANVPVVSPTSQSRLEMFNSVQLLIMSPMHRRHVPVDAGTSPSLMTIWKPDFTLYHKSPFSVLNCPFLFQKLLKSLFGTNVASQPDMYHLPYSTKHLVETRGDPTFSIDAPSEPLKEEKPPLEPVTLYETIIKDPCSSFEASLLAGRQMEQGSQDVFKKARLVLLFHDCFDTSAFALCKLHRA